MSKALLAIMLMLFSSFTVAKWYQVEIIVFEHLQVDDGNEFWDPGSLPSYDDDNPIQLRPDFGGSGAFEELPSRAYRLNSVKERLNGSGIYRPLYHVAWRQPGSSASNLKKTLIDIPEEGIIGTVGLIAGHLLHIKVDLSYLIRAVTEFPIPLTDTELSVERANEITPPSQTTPLTDAEQEEEQAVADDHIQDSVTRLKETRQLKLNELHYFDHPLFGVLIQVRRQLNVDGEQDP